VTIVKKLHIGGNC